MSRLTTVYTAVEMMVRVATALDEEVVSQYEDVEIIAEPGSDPYTVYRNWRKATGRGDEAA